MADQRGQPSDRCPCGAVQRRSVGDAVKGIPVANLPRKQLKSCPPDSDKKTGASTAQRARGVGPPYLPSTRGATKVYEHEFDRDQHKRLLQIVGKFRKAKVILCGYRNEMYQESLDGWRRTDFKTKSFAASRAKGCRLDERVLSVWTNYLPMD